MANPPPRLLITLPETEVIRQEVARNLPEIPAAFVNSESVGPWPTAEALLVGAPQRELPSVAPGLMPRLRFVQRVFTGLDAFPFASFAPEVQVAGNVGGYAPFVAEQALTLMLALANDLVPNCGRVREGRIRPVNPPRWLHGHRALLLGFGEIAHALAVRLRAFDVRVEGLSRSGAPDPLAERMYPASALLEALGSAEFVVDCRPLTKATRSTIGRAALERMKPDAILVNVGRAGTIDEEALYLHLKAHPEFRFGTDVFWQEDFAKGTIDPRWPFTALPNFIASPHIAGVGAEARRRALLLALANLKRFFDGQPVLHVADRREYD